MTTNHVYQKLCTMVVILSNLCVHYVSLSYHIKFPISCKLSTTYISALLNKIYFPELNIGLSLNHLLWDNKYIKSIAIIFISNYVEYNFGQGCSVSDFVFIFVNISPCKGSHFTLTFVETWKIYTWYINSMSWVQKELFIQAFEFSSYIGHSTKTEVLQDINIHSFEIPSWK